MVVTQKNRFRKFWRPYLDQNLLRITNPVSDLTGDQYFYVIFRSCDSGNHHTIFKICMGDSPHTTHHTNPGKNQHPPFLKTTPHLGAQAQCACCCCSSSSSCCCCCVHTCVRGCLRDRHRVSADLLVGANPAERIKISHRSIDVFWKSS
jgi:hypothetical protein